MEYTVEQRKAISVIEENLQIIAGAGSGKTAVVAQRAINILKQKPHIKPGNLVAITFTDKAGEEIKSRILRLAQEQIGDIQGMSELYAGTFHGFCLQLLQEYVVTYQKYSVLDTIKNKIFIDKNYEKSGMPLVIKVRNGLGAGETPMRIYIDTDKYMGLLSVLRESELESALPPHLQQALVEYETLMHEHAYFDFTMIMNETLKLLKNDKDFFDKATQRVRYLTIDEYQDTNPIQEKLLQIFHSAGTNICVVGDDDQTLYQWRGSDIDNILTFDKRYNVQNVAYLMDNFRSSKGIVELSHGVIQNNQERKEKQMIPQSDKQYEKGDMVYKEFEEEEEEYQFIADRILDLHEMGLPFSEIAVLLRVKKLGKGIMRTLQRNQIPFVIEGVNELFETEEIGAIKATFDYLNGFNKKHIGNRVSKQEVIQAWLSIDYPLESQNIERAITRLEYWKPENFKFYHEYIIQKIYQEFLDLLELKEVEGVNENRLEIILYNLGKFSQAIHDFETIYYRTVAENKLKYFCKFLEHTAGGYYPEGHLQNAYIQPDAVRIMTIHQSKGLEFGAVFIPGLCKNIFPAQKIGGLSMWHFIPFGLVRNENRYSSGDLESERRLFYVAATRSKKFLFLTRAKYKEIYKGKNSIVSPFLVESKHSGYIFEYDDHVQKDYRIRPKLSWNGAKDLPIVLNFSVLKDFYNCSYRFKLSFFYGFVQPIEPAMGYGKSVHNMIYEIHKRAAAKEDLGGQVLEKILSRHFHLPYANEQMKINMRQKAEKTISEYIGKNGKDFDRIVFVEKEIEIAIGEGVRVTGRIDLVKRKEVDDNEQTYIVDFKTEIRSLSEDVGVEQLKIYALGYKELTGENADFIEVYNLDNQEPNRKRILQDDLAATKDIILHAAGEIRNNRLEKVCEKNKCTSCYLNYLCLSREKKREYEISPVAI
ncbi:ATP-dependent helicase [Paenibacillus sp. Soil724D2]|uniref:ATP-dependent helicase n=1 Tax=Paenibacillus sp. (strain Soil724D2) TaxID=1736392 RepID=UPI0007142B54|nr:ATP-dependent DNA helicase [Paenibacillus sp. Soil724D2]KRE48376.1 hypothetical protein ASG85_05075 [Paenibacillus sp. Soil724D2]